jgi:hypothetical protein
MRPCVLRRLSGGRRAARRGPATSGVLRFTESEVDYSWHMGAGWDTGGQAVLHPESCSEGCSPWDRQSHLPRELIHVVPASLSVHCLARD